MKLKKDFKMKISKVLTTIAIIVCSYNSFAESFKISTEPRDATIYIRDLKTTQNTKVGMTPYEGSISELASTYVKSDFFMIIIEKSGYETQTILLNDIIKSDIELNFNLIPKEDILIFRALDKNINDLFEAQRLIRTNAYDDAITLLKKVESEQPKLSIIPEMIGSAYYLKKDYKSALTGFDKSYRMNPENRDAFSMRSYIRTALKVTNGDEK